MNFTNIFREYNAYRQLRNKTCSPGFDSLVQTKANIWETATLIFTDLLSNSPKHSPRFSPGYEGTENMFYFLIVNILLFFQGAMMSIAFKEGLKIPPQAMEQVITGANQDLRQVYKPPLLPFIHQATSLPLRFFLSFSTSSILSTFFNPFNSSCIVKFRQLDPILVKVEIILLLIFSSLLCLINYRFLMTKCFILYMCYVRRN